MHIFFRDGKARCGSGWLLRKHAGFAPARQSLLGFRPRSPLPSGEEPCPLGLHTVFLSNQPEPIHITDLRTLLRKAMHFCCDGRQIL
jgi:hypothetical protein